MALEEYILRNPFSVEKMTLESPTDLVIYRSRLNAKINRNFVLLRQACVARKRGEFAGAQGERGVEAARG